MFKVAFDLDEITPTWPPFATERIWARKTGFRGQLELVNIPFFALGISRGDIIRVHPDHERRELVFDEVVRHSGASTVRILIHDESASDRILGILRDSGCEWEFSTVDIHLAANIPESASYRNLRESLLELKGSGSMGLEEAFISELHRSQTMS